VYRTTAPVSTEAGAVFTIERSADAATWVDTDELLLPESGSGVEDATSAVLVSAADPAGAVTTTVMVEDAPDASVDVVQLTDTLNALEHDHAEPPSTDTNVVPAGNVSVTDTATASEGPALLTSRSYETNPPAATCAGPDFTIERSADAVTVVSTDDRSLPGTGSLVVLETCAEFVRDAASVGAVTTIVIVGAVTPEASKERVHVTDTLPELEHDQLAPPSTDTNVVPAGSVSVTDTATASDGPALLTSRSYEIALPATTSAGPAFTMDRSASPVTSVEADDLLLSGAGSGVVEDTSASFCRVAA
jgi:hypothetical protein